jgi:NADPH2:quinone reductase
MREFGPPRVLEPAEVDDLRAGPGEVVIDVEFANVTFVETQVRAGKPPHPSMLPALPAILGNGVGGTVAETETETETGDGDGAETGDGAESGAEADAKARAAAAGSGLAGRRVVASLNGTGGYAERVVCSASRLIEVPDGVALRDAVALLADGRTALALARRAGLRQGDTVLVEAAAGGVGTLLVQLARNAGARVVALAGQPRKLAIARDLGADLTVDYSKGDWARQVRDAAGHVDVVFDGVGGDIGLAAFGLLGAGGRFCPFGMASGKFAPVTPELAQAHQVTVLAGAGASPEEMMALVRTVLTEAAAGRIRPVIGQEFGLAAAADAHAAIEARTTIGKTLLTVPQRH